jgi:hypothetical protein
MERARSGEGGFWAEIAGVVPGKAVNGGLKLAISSGCKAAWRAKGHVGIDLARIVFDRPQKRGKLFRTRIAASEVTDGCDRYVEQRNPPVRTSWPLHLLWV